MLRQYKVKYLHTFNVYPDGQPAGIKSEVHEAILDFASDGYGFYDEKCQYDDNLISTVGAIADYGFCKVGINPDKYILADKIISIEAYGDTSFKKAEQQVVKDQKKEESAKRPRRKFYKFTNENETSKEAQQSSNTSTFSTTDCSAPATN